MSVKSKRCRTESYKKKPCTMDIGKCVITPYIQTSEGIMFIHKVGDSEVIFDSEADYDLVTLLGGRKHGRRKIYVDKSIKKKPYARVSFEGKDLRIHHMLSGKPSQGKVIDHFNGNSLDNRRSNLREVTRSENGYNKTSKTKHRWITKQKNGKFQVCFRIGLGTYSTLEEAQDVVRGFLRENNIKIYKDFYDGTSNKE